MLQAGVYQPAPPQQHDKAAAGQRRFNGACYNCGKPGHRQADCRQPRKQRAEPPAAAAADSGQRPNPAANLAQAKPESPAASKPAVMMAKLSALMADQKSLDENVEEDTEELYQQAWQRVLATRTRTSARIEAAASKPTSGVVGKTVIREFDGKKYRV